MTARSDYHNAEKAAIAAARIMADYIERIARNARQYRQVELLQAVRALDALPLPDASVARSSRGAPLTSQNAAAYFTGYRATTLAALICRTLLSAAGGLTVDGLCVGLDRRHQSVSARVHDLAENGWIHPLVDGEIVTRKTRSGEEAIVWVLTPAARRELTVARNIAEEDARGR